MLNLAAIFTLVKTGVSLLMHAFGVDGRDVEDFFLKIPVLGKLFWLIWMPIKGLLIAFSYVVIVAIAGFCVLVALILVAGPLEFLIEAIVGDDQFHQRNPSVVWIITFSFWGLVLSFLGWRWYRTRKDITSPAVEKESTES